MKKLIIIGIALFAFSQLIAQQKSPANSKSNQLNIGYFNVLRLNDENNFGLGYKHTFKNGAIRFGSHFHYDHRSLDRDNPEAEQTQNIYSISPRIGYEFHLNYNKWQVFYGIDILSEYDHNKSTLKYEVGTDTRIIENFAIGIGPLVGLKFQINKNISISTETHLEAMYSKNRQKRENYNAEVQTTESNEFSTNLNPLGMLSVNIHF
ncbi:MAG: hypothetical protein K9G58_10485 [Bacteroidales bacterium]|nr:hypothetical protein [Bacteroidales bacterium]MCF8386525.1 hypothetical protein [Bacteroidales bacterium]MCF8398588.1 hypothetical protein [Bacteroidales bacterium]